MTQEEKDLLLKDITARLPYGVKIKRSTCPINLSVTGILGEYVHHTPYYVGGNIEIKTTKIDEVKPYLRPMSSMTEEELDECVEYSGIRGLECPKIETFEDRLLWAIKMFSTDYKSIDWLNEHHFDFRGLIEKGLALEAPDNMYKQ